MKKHSTDPTRLFSSFPRFCILSFLALIAIGSVVGALWGLFTLCSWQSVTIGIWLCFVLYLFAIPAEEQKRIQDHWLKDIWEY